MGASDRVGDYNARDYARHRFSRNTEPFFRIREAGDPRVSARRRPGSVAAAALAPDAHSDGAAYSTVFCGGYRFIAPDSAYDWFDSY